MKNWNTDTSKFKSKQDLKIWKMSQLINYGFGSKKIKINDLKENWTKLKKLLDGQRARMVEYLIWNKKYSLPTNSEFWGLSPKTNS